MSCLSDSSANGSPRRQKRPVSIVCDGKQLPAITEITELVSMSNGCCSPSATDWRLLATNASTTNSITTTTTTSITTTAANNTTNGNPCKFDPAIRAKAEHLLGKVSLDGPDLTVTSLNFIDDTYANSLTRRTAGSNGSPSAAAANNNNSSQYHKIQTIQDYFNRKTSLRSPEPQNK